MSLRTVYAPYFKIGAAVPRGIFLNETAKEHMRLHYNSLTCENDMKPEMILDAEKNQADPKLYDRNPAVCFEHIRPYLEFAKANNIQMRGHTLVWYSQTPDWFFRKNYETDADAMLADRDTMLARMESYICSVLTFVQTEYPGVVYAWDVVNEAIREYGFRKCFWLETVGKDYVLKAFEFAAKYAEDGVRLIYNDYETFIPEIRDHICELVLKPLTERGLIHGVGMQSHLNMQTDLNEYENALRTFGATGLEVQITELDIHIPVNTPESMHALANRYRQVFELLVKAKKEHLADITSVTLWGIRDEDSWLEWYGEENSYPLLFHKNYMPKESYDAVVSVPAKLEKKPERRHVDYAAIRGFNYTQSNAGNDYDFWMNYDHDIVARDMGYAQRLNLNSARIFLSWQAYEKLQDSFFTRVKDFVQTAWSYGISVNPIIYHGFAFVPEEKKEKTGRLPALSATIEDRSCWYLGEQFFDKLLEAIGEEPGLLFWDISNEPGYTDDFVTWYEEEPEYLQEFRDKPDLEELREKQEKTWEIVRHFCRYVREKDPVHEIGVGNIFIFETEPSRTIDLVDVIVFHDYSATRKRMKRIYDMAFALSEKYGKPIVNNETGCLCRSNPYDMTLEFLEENQVGWYHFELMNGEDGWNKVHGLVYPDGTIRDPAIIAALFGFYRRRKGEIIRVDVNQEGYVSELLIRIRNILREMNAHNRKPDDKERLLELCENAANMLEAGELTAMAYPPTARVEYYRRQHNTDLDEVKDWLYELGETLRKACRL